MGDDQFGGADSSDELSSGSDWDDGSNVANVEVNDEDNDFLKYATAFHAQPTSSEDVKTFANIDKDTKTTEDNDLVVPTAAELSKLENNAKEAVEDELSIDDALADPDALIDNIDVDNAQLDFAKPAEDVAASIRQRLAEKAQNKEAEPVTNSNELSLDVAPPADPAERSDEHLTPELKEDAKQLDKIVEKDFQGLDSIDSNHHDRVNDEDNDMIVPENAEVAASEASSASDVDVGELNAALDNLDLDNLDDSKFLEKPEDEAQVRAGMETHVNEESTNADTDGGHPLFGSGDVLGAAAALNDPELDEIVASDDFRGLDSIDSAKIPSANDENDMIIPDAAELESHQEHHQALSQGDDDTDLNKALDNIDFDSLNNEQFMIDPALQDADNKAESNVGSESLGSNLNLSDDAAATAQDADDLSFDSTPHVSAPDVTVAQPEDFINPELDKVVTEEFQGLDGIDNNGHNQRSEDEADMIIPDADELASHEEHHNQLLDADAKEMHDAVDQLDVESLDNSEFMNEPTSDQVLEDATARVETPINVEKHLENSNVEQILASGDYQGLDSYDDNKTGAEEEVEMIMPEAEEIAAHEAATTEALGGNEDLNQAFDKLDLDNLDPNGDALVNDAHELADAARAAQQEAAKEQFAAEAKEHEAELQEPAFVAEDGQALGADELNLDNGLVDVSATDVNAQADEAKADASESDFLGDAASQNVEVEEASPFETELANELETTPVVEDAQVADSADEPAMWSVPQDDFDITKVSGANNTDDFDMPDMAPPNFAVDNDDEALLDSRIDGSGALADMLSDVPADIPEEIVLQSGSHFNHQADAKDAEPAAPVAEESTDGLGSDMDNLGMSGEADVQGMDFLDPSFGNEEQNAADQSFVGDMMSDDAHQGLDLGKEEAAKENEDFVGNMVSGDEFNDGARLASDALDNYDLHLDQAANAEGLASTDADADMSFDDDVFGGDGQLPGFDESTFADADASDSDMSDFGSDLGADAFDASEPFDPNTDFIGNSDDAEQSFGLDSGDNFDFDDSLFAGDDLNGEVGEPKTKQFKAIASNMEIRKKPRVKPRFFFALKIQYPQHHASSNYSINGHFESKRVAIDGIKVKSSAISGQNSGNCRKNSGICVNQSYIVVILVGQIFLQSLSKLTQAISSIIKL